MISALIQARMSSQRLPGKVLLPLAGRTVLEQVVARVRSAQRLVAVAVVTSSEPSDDPIAALCQERKIPHYRGSLNDVLDRYYQAAKALGCDSICRITADCPLIPPELINLVASEFEAGNYDYAATNRPLGQESYPDGFDIEIIRATALEAAWKEARDPFEREHVTPFIWRHPDRFRCFFQRCKGDLSKVRLTLDTREDYDKLCAISENVKPLKTPNILSYLGVDAALYEGAA